MAGPRNRTSATASPSARLPASSTTAPNTAPLGQSAGGAPVQTPQERANEALRARLDPSHPNYIGPGYAAFMDGDKLTLKVVNPQAQEEWRAAQSRATTTGAARPSVPTLDDLNAAVAPTQTAPAPLSLDQQFARAATNPALAGPQPSFAFSSPLQSAVTPASTARRTTAMLSGFDIPSGAGAGAGAGVATSANPEAAGPAEVDRAKIDALLGNVSKATSGVMGIAGLEDQYSAAQAQLALGLGAAQANSLALARGGNRRDAAALGARALQTNSEMAGEATRSSALLRAQEEDAVRRLKLDAFKAAGDLGLNAAALELNAEGLNMQAATSYLNNLFETNRLGMQLDEAEAARVTNFIRDMALIEKDYHALSLQEQAAIRDDLTRRHGINENTRLGLEQLERQGEVNWGQMGANFLMGLGSGAASGAMALLSDRRMKTEIRDTTEDDLEDLLSTVRSQTYRYIGARGEKGTHLGLMAQDLKRSRLGASMVDETSDGTLVVDGGKAAGAALSAVSKVYDRLKHLEASL